MQCRIGGGGSRTAIPGRKLRGCVGHRLGADQGQGLRADDQVCRDEQNDETPPAPPVEGGETLTAASGEICARLIKYGQFPRNCALPTILT